MSELKENVDYKFIISEVEQSVSFIEILSGAFAGIVYQYYGVKIEEHGDIGAATLHFNYNIVDSSKFSVDELNSNLDFKNYIGDILSSIIMTRVPDGYEDRTDDN